MCMCGVAAAGEYISQENVDRDTPADACCAEERTGQEPARAWEETGGATEVKKPALGRR